MLSFLDKLSPSTLRRIKIILPTAAIVCLTAGSVWAWWLSPPAMPDDMNQAVDVLASGRYQRLDKDARQRYLDRAAELFINASPEDRQGLRQKFQDHPELRRVMREVGQEMMDNQVERFIAASPQERQQILDDVIDRQQAFMRRPGDGPRTRPSTRPSGGPQGGPPGWGGSSSDRRQRAADRQEKGNPQQQALRREFFEAMRQRQQERQKKGH
ncbi:MAG: hypothetical protein IT442_15260 [Phycisphaeraceae bacterium]|nr:hypothetical protein [Phycisphaeraceae bacterium]